MSFGRDELDCSCSDEMRFICKRNKKKFREKKRQTDKVLFHKLLRGTAIVLQIRLCLLIVFLQLCPFVHVKVCDVFFSVKPQGNGIGQKE